ncbi:MAG: hypothetical protein MJZ11_08925 [Lachnospiraceae bacterium]|nr:hypothetical protein [Lachnospiraceae bacterium]
MTPEEIIQKSEQRIRAEKQKIAEAKKEAGRIRRDAENHQKYTMGGLVAKYLKEEMKLDYMDFSEEELTRIIACAMKHRDIKNMVNTVLSERKSAITENAKNEGAGDDEGNGEN